MIDVTVTVDDGHLGSIRAVAAALTDRGMHVGAVLPTVGVITGSCAESDRSALESVPGVATVEAGHTFATSTHRPDAPPPPDEASEDPLGDVELAREPDGSYRVVRRIPRRPDGGGDPS